MVLGVVWHGGVWCVAEERIKKKTLEQPERERWDSETDRGVNVPIRVTKDDFKERSECGGGGGGEGGMGMWGLRGGEVGVEKALSVIQRHPSRWSDLMFEKQSNI